MSAGFAFASSTDGTIDSTYKYAWGENIGWINFGTSQGDVHITDSGLSGYALGENTGWLNLDNVTNDGAGNLSGYAWGENIGWINFAPTNGGVIINSSGEFTGSALGENTGWIIFDCDYKVKTDWRPQSARPACNNATDDDGDGKTDYPNDPGCASLTDNDETDPASGGGGLPSGAYNPPTPPAEGFSILINDGDKYTESREVTFKLIAGSDAARMTVSNNPDLKGGTGQIPFQSSYDWDLCYRKPECPEASYTVYVRFYTRYGQPSEIVSDTIVFRKEKPVIEKIKEVPKKVIEEVKKIPEKIKEISEKIKEIIKPKPKPEEKPELLPIEEVVPKEAPLVFQGKWQLLPSKPIQEFVLAPLPEEIRALTEKFPQLEKTFEEVGIAKITDIEKLKTVKLSLPGLTERLELPITKVEPGKFALPQSVPVAKLSSGIKQELPSEIVFARTGGELIDFNIALTVTEEGKPQQSIRTISGEPLQLVVKPDKPVKSVKGYIVFKKKREESSSSQLPLASLTASLMFAEPAFAFQQEKPVRVEERLVLMEFEYTDPDNDGIYTAEVPAPIVEGEYEIITVMDYEDPDLGRKEIRLIAVVDPEGYIYEKDRDKETRIPGAIVSLYWLNPETKHYELWPAKEYQQESPQITDATGKYSFLVPEGSYYLKVEAPGYLIYDGKLFQVKEGSGVHVNIELKTKYWWLKVVDWKTILLAAVIILLFYNFYRDKIRDRIKKQKLRGKN